MDKARASARSSDGSHWLSRTRPDKLWCLVVLKYLCFSFKFSSSRLRILKPVGRNSHQSSTELQDQGVSQSNKTCFAYLSFAKEGKLSEEKILEHVGIDLFCGRFSFADLPNSYACIMGVTGTLRELLDIPSFDKMLRNEYGFKHFTYAPSIFGAPRLTFKPAEHIHAPGQVEVVPRCVENKMCINTCSFADCTVQSCTSACPNSARAPARSLRTSRTGCPALPCWPMKSDGTGTLQPSRRPYAESCGRWSH